MPTFTLPHRDGTPPETGKQPPQLQFSDTSPRDVYARMAAWFFAAFAETREAPTRISVPTTRALWLDEGVDAAPHAFMPPAGSREFAHLHEDGSFHLVLAPEDRPCGKCLASNCRPAKDCGPRVGGCSGYGQE